MSRYIEGHVYDSRSSADLDVCIRRNEVGHVCVGVDDADAPEADHYVDQVEEHHEPACVAPSQDAYVPVRGIVQGHREGGGLRYRVRFYGRIIRFRGGRLCFTSLSFIARLRII